MRSSVDISSMDIMLSPFYITLLYNAVILIFFSYFVNMKMRYKHKNLPALGRERDLIYIITGTLRTNWLQ